MQQTQFFTTHDRLLGSACFAARLCETRRRERIDTGIDGLHLRDTGVQQFDGRDLAAGDQTPGVLPPTTCSMQRNPYAGFPADD